jgi:hypothetical protein
MKTFSEGWLSTSNLKLELSLIGKIPPRSASLSVSRTSRSISVVGSVWNKLCDAGSPFPALAAVSAPPLLCWR